MSGERERMRAAGRVFGEDVVEAVLWEAVEDALLYLRPRGALEGWAEGLEAWGRDLLERWPAEVAGFIEAFVEDNDAGRLDRLRDRPYQAAQGSALRVGRPLVPLSLP